MAARALAAAPLAAAASHRSIQPPQRAAAARVAHPPPRQQRRRPAAAAMAISAAQKKAFTSFNDMITNSAEPVFVEFYATWCGPCQMQGQILDEVAPALRHRVRFVKVDTEKYPGVASQYHIGALPTMILFKDGQPVDRLEGVVMPGDLKNRLEYQLAKKG